jgi:hypothetical protein
MARKQGSSVFDVLETKLEELKKERGCATSSMGRIEMNVLCQFSCPQMSVLLFAVTLVPILEVAHPRRKQGSSVFDVLETKLEELKKERGCATSSMGTSVLTMLENREGESVFDLWADRVIPH